MLRSKTLQKVLAIILIFTLTSTNFAFVTKAYASGITDIAEALFGSKSDTGSKNVRFETYFKTEEENVSSVISDVNNEELAISMDLSVEESGYLKDTSISILETEDENYLNFRLKELDSLPEHVQNIENNTLILDQISSYDGNVLIDLPIEYKNEKYFNESDLSRSFTVVLDGTYLDNKGNEQEIHKEVPLTVSWTDEREAKIEVETEKYIDFGSGVIVQSKLLVNTYTEANTLPIKETNLSIDVPSYLGVIPSSVFVVANSTLGTNGENASDLSFNDSNWVYDYNNGKINITVLNEKKLVTVNEYEDEYLQDAEKELIEEERYYNIPGEDEYLITYTYNNVEIPEEPVSIISNIESRITLLSNNTDESNVIENSYTYSDELTECVGDLVSLNINDETLQISKAYFYSNLNEEKYDIELNSEVIINITHKDMLENLIIEDARNRYIDSEEQSYNTNDIFYKEISISKQNMLDVLGEDGLIEIYNNNNEYITSIKLENSSVTQDENIVVEFNTIYSKLIFKTSAPVKEGNLVINAKKVIRGISASKDVVESLKYVSTEMILRAKYQNVVEDVNVNTSEIKVELLDTETKATLSIDKDSLSTLAVNENVELRIALNNASKMSDLYGHSEFEITLPESIEEIKLHNLEENNNAKIIHGDELYVSSAELTDRTLKIDIDGQQLGINTIDIEKGTFISFIADIKVNPYITSKTEKMTLKYFNSEATNYYNNGEDEVEINYSAPSGFIAVSTLRDYNDNGRTISSITKGLFKDEPTTDLLEIYSSAKVATAEIMVMNNNSNNVSDMAILGRFPFKGNKDILVDSELGTTLTPRIVEEIKSDENNDIAFDIYYSENENANRNLNDSSNGWSKEISLENAKSYLILPTDENYLMKGQTVLKFTYKFEIPENLSHNESIYSTFVAYYTNIFEDQIATSQASPYLIGLTTGEGPEANLVISSNENEVRELGEVTVTLVAENTGKDRIEDVNINFEIPDSAVYMTSSSEYEIKEENQKLLMIIPELESGAKAEAKIILQANAIPQDFEGEYYIELKASLTAKDLGTTLNFEGNKVLVKEAEFKIVETDKVGSRTTEVYREESEVIYSTYVTNIKSSTMSNVVATKVLPEELTFESATSRIKGVETPAEYDESSRTITWRIGDLESESMFFLETKAKVNYLKDNLTECTVDSTTTVRGDSTAPYNSNNVSIFIGKPVLSIKQETSNTNTYVKEGSIVNYIFTVANTGSVEATNVKLTEIIPEGLNIRSISYKLGETNLSKNAESLERATVQGITIAPKSEMIVNVEAVAAGLNGALEKTVTNYGTVEADKIEEMESEKITHIVEASEKNQNEYTLEESKSATRATSKTATDIIKTYKISGIAWKDENKDGSRDSNEPLLPGISAKLVSSNNGKIISSVTTDVNGQYTFAGVENGQYIIIFDYDTTKYRVTAYKKSGIATNTNSDAISTNIEQDGKSRNAAMTEVIEISNGSVSNIDIGLVLADVFDLRIDKTITKVTVQTSKGTTTQKHDNLKMVKTEIAAKNLAGAIVYVEYEIKVTNVGDIPGYAKKIIDYIPNGMTFNSSVGTNAYWYTGANNNLYTEELANRELQAGESATVKLVLTRQMTLENTNIVNNQAEIYEDYNVYNVSDQNSKPANKTQGENDISSADIAIMVKTGESFINVSVIIMTILLMSIVVFIVRGKVVSIIRRREGV